MRNYEFKDIEYWGNKIESTARKLGLDFFPQDFKICDKQEMKERYAYIFSRRYPHWSFGKSYQKVDSLSGYVPFSVVSELVVNANPSLAFLWEGNSLAKHILIMAYVYGHNDFFKNNMAAGFVNLPEGSGFFRENAVFVKELLKRPDIDEDEVERFIDAAHALRNQRSVGPNNETCGKNKNPRTNLLKFILDNRKDLSDWQRRILRIVDEEADYFVPFLEVNIMQKGWASYWQSRILSELNLPSNLALECISLHSKIVGHIPKATLNPSGVGFGLFKDIKQRWDKMAQNGSSEEWDGLTGDEKLFHIRKNEKDADFLRNYLSENLVAKLKLVQYCRETDLGLDLVDWTKIRDTFIRNAGLNQFPVIDAVDGNFNNTGRLYLRQIPDFRKLDNEWAKKTLEHVFLLWGKEVCLEAIFSEEKSNMPFLLLFNGKTHCLMPLAFAPYVDDDDDYDMPMLFPMMLVPFY